MDSLTVAVAHELSSRYCPTNKESFLVTLVVLVVAFCVAGIVLRRFGRVARIAGIVLILFALGGTALDLFGLSGCGPHFSPGLTWDHPW